MKQYEVIIIGSSYAGLSAAMALGRAIRNVLIIDGGKPCNRNTPHAHNLLTRDGETPATLSAIAREQVMQYDTVTFSDDLVTDIQKVDDAFAVTTASGMHYNAAKLLFATGVKDNMPAIDGFAECWGISIIHCPYCHGYEVRNIQTAIMANGDAAYHYSTILLQWSEDLTIFTNGASTITAEQQVMLSRHNITIVEDEIQSLKHDDGHLTTIITKNDSHDFTVMYSRVPFTQVTDLPVKLGVTLTDDGLLTADDFGRTAVPGIYAAGDAVSMLRALPMAIASGTRAGTSINYDLCLEEFGKV